MFDVPFRAEIVFITDIDTLTLTFMVSLNQDGGTLVTQPPIPVSNAGTKH